MLTEKEMMTYGTLIIVGVGSVLFVDAYIKGINTYIPIMLEMRR